MPTQSHLKSTQDNGSASRLGFTLIELLVVVAIISLLIAIIIPSLSGARRSAERTNCAARLRDVGMALRSYLSYNNEIMPYASYMPSYGPAPLNGPDPIYISKVLSRDAAEQLEIFHCPSDRITGARPAPNENKTYFESEGTSYEFRQGLGGRTLQEYINHRAEHTGTRIAENTIWIFRDFENFHATAGTTGSRRYLYIDGHVTDYE